MVAEPMSSPNLDPYTELLFFAYTPYVGLAVGQIRVAAMLLIHIMDSDEE